MRSLRRVVRTLVAAWAGGMLVKAIGSVVEMSTNLEATLVIVATLIGGVAGWVASRGVPPWSAGDLRDGAIGWGLVGGAILVLLAFAFSPSGWQLPGVLIAITASAGLAFAVHRSADRLGAA